MTDIKTPDTKTPTDIMPFIKIFVNILTLGFGLSLFIFGVILFYIYFNVSLDTQKQKSWLETDGIILKSSVKAQTLDFTTDNRNKKKYNTKKVKKTITEYYPDMTYSYSVNGKKYSSSQLGGFNRKNKANLNPRSISSVEAVIAKYPVGKKIKVFYNPDNPKEAVKDKQLTPSIIILAFGSFFFLLSFLIMFIGKKLLMALFTMILSSNNFGMKIYNAKNIENS